MTSSGNVGIGTITPANTLNVIGDANITGGLYVAGNNMTTPDYVFEAFFGKETFRKENENNYFEFFPLHTVYKIKNRERFSQRANKVTVISQHSS